MSVKIRTAMLAVTLFLPGAPAFSQALDPNQVGKAAPAEKPVPELLAEARQAYDKGDHAALRDALIQLRRQRPYNSEYMYQLVLAHGRLDEKKEAYNLMLEMQRQGLAYDFDQDEATKSLRNTEVYTYINDLMKRAGDPIGQAEIVARLEPGFVRPEAIDWDPGREAFLVGNVRDGAIIAVTLDGESRELLRADSDNGMWGVYDLVVDAEGNRLWVATASNQQFAGFDPADTGRSALFEFDLESLDLVKRYPVPVDGLPHNLRSIALAPNGDIMATDGLYPIIYRKKSGESRLRPVLALEKLVALRGLEFSPDGKRLYVADHEMGILVVDMESGNSGSLATPPTLNLGGIEGLATWQNRLVVIQNGIRPQRILALELDEAGRRVVNIAPLAVAMDIMDFPNYGTVVGSDLVFFANSHWTLDSEERKPVTVARVSIDKAPEIVPVDVEKFRADYMATKQGEAEAGADEDRE